MRINCLYHENYIQNGAQGNHGVEDAVEREKTKTTDLMTFRSSPPNSYEQQSHYETASE